MDILLVSCVPYLLRAYPTLRGHIMSMKTMLPRMDQGGTSRTSTKQSKNRSNKSQNRSSERYTNTQEFRSEWFHG